MALLVVAGVAAVVVRPLLSGEVPEARPSTRPTQAATPLDSMDVSDLPIERASFCGRLDEDDVVTALAAPVSATRHYENGDRAVLTRGLRDVSHEFACTFRAGSGAHAQAWVFAAPVTQDEGRSILRDAERERGCRRLLSTPTYGTPSVATLCRSSRPASRSVTLRGLFGDAWLSCRLSTPPGLAGPARTERRAERWCVSVATAIGDR
jgi:hypothetical protein